MSFINFGDLEKSAVSMSENIGNTVKNSLASVENAARAAEGLVKVAGWNHGSKIAQIVTSSVQTAEGVAQTATGTVEEGLRALEGLTPSMIATALTPISANLITRIDTVMERAVSINAEGAVRDFLLHHRKLVEVVDTILQDASLVTDRASKLPFLSSIGFVSNLPKVEAAINYVESQLEGAMNQPAPAAPSPAPAPAPDQPQAQPQAPDQGQQQAPDQVQPQSQTQAPGQAQPQAQPQTPDQPQPGAPVAPTPAPVADPTATTQNVPVQQPPANQPPADPAAGTPTQP